MRIIDGNNVMDVTSIHPESYDVAIRLIKDLASSINDIGTAELNKKLTNVDIEMYAENYNTDRYTIEDIIKCLQQPNRDFRDNFTKPILKSNILRLEDLNIGMQLQGTVRNVVDFGAFIDIGLHDDALVHISKITDSYIQHPLEVLSVGDIVICYVDSINMTKGKVNLSLIKPNMVDES